MHLGPHSVSATEEAPFGMSYVWWRKEIKSFWLARVMTLLLASCNVVHFDDPGVQLNNGTSGLIGPLVEEDKMEWTSTW